MFTPRTHPWYIAFLQEQGFEGFLQIPTFTIRHRIKEALVRRFHAEIGTFHLGYWEYVILLLYWMAILGIRFGGLPIPTNEMSFNMAYELLVILLPLTMKTRG